MRVLGIDPGTIELGWGWLETTPSGKIVGYDHGSLKVPSKKDFILRVGEMSDLLGELFSAVKPQAVAVEKIFLGKNVDSAFKLGHVRGVCVAKCHELGASVFEYSPRVVKKQITGSGSAEKILVRNLLYRQLGIRENPQNSLDASDALALAFCHIMQDSVNRRLGKAEL